MTLKLASLTWDSQDPARLAAFWTDALDWRIAQLGSERLTVTPTDPTDFTFTFAASSEEKVGANRIHLDLSSHSIDDQHETAARLISIGASEVNIGQEPDAPHIVLADPDGNEFCVLEPGNKFVTYSSRVGSLTCDGTRAVGCFWSQALGSPLVWDHNQETAIRLPDGARQFVTWGGPPVAWKRGKNRLHLDLAPPPGGAQEAAVESLLSLGASLIDTGQRDVDWTVMADPDGNEFCVYRSA
jgi:predicted enzyme related to lactoylglutathione lyase